MMGNCEEALLVSRGLLANPRHPTLNADSNNKSSVHYGRLRHLETLEQFELWDFALKELATGDFSTSGNDDSLIKTQRLSGIAHFSLGHLTELKQLCADLSAEMEKRKKAVQALSVYKGVSDSYSSAYGGSSLMSYDSNFSSGSLFSNDGMGYTDLRQAYAESVIPVTEDDYNKTQKFRNIKEYKRNRDAIDTKPLSKEEAMRQLFNENKQKDEESAALAFYYAQQAEKAKANQDNFWSGLKQVTNF
jgi:hypothetical protein